MTQYTKSWLIILFGMTQFLYAQIDTKSTALDIASRKQLLIADTLFESSRGIRFAMNAPYQDETPLLTADLPWEIAAKAEIHIYASVLYENGLFRLWYTLHTNDPNQALCICYAESKDGIHFVKPDLNLFELNGSKANNIVIPGTVGGPAVWIDPKAPPLHRYKTQARVYKPKTCFQMHSSPDGIHWTLFAEIEVHPHDTQNIIFWDESISRYVLFGRELVPYQTEPKKRYYRQVRRLESDNLKDWDSPSIVLEADAIDLNSYPSPTKQPPVDYYGGGVFRYPDPQGPYLMFAHPFWHWKTRSPAESRSINADVDEKHLQSLAPATIDVRLAASRDGKSFQHAPERKPFLSLGKQGGHFSRLIWASPNPIPRNDELWIYYVGRNYDHESFLDPSSEKPKAALARAVLRLDGFLAAEAGNQPGEFTTIPLRFTGSQLLLNLDASAGGSALVEILDEKNQPFPGFSRQDCEPLYGNSVRMTARWRNQSDLTPLAGKTVKLRIILQNAKLYAFQFSFP